MQVAFRGLGGLLRGAGAAIDAAGASLQGKLAPAEKLLPCVSRLTIGGATPVVPEGVFVAPNAAVMGHVELGAHSSVWYGATLRGDVQKIKIGHTTNIQDRAIIHVAKHNPQDKELPTTIGNNVRASPLLLHSAALLACYPSTVSMRFNRNCVRQLPEFTHARVHPGGRCAWEQATNRPATLLS